MWLDGILHFCTDADDPQIGAPPEPMLPVGERHRIRWMGLARPRHVRRLSSPNPTTRAT